MSDATAGRKGDWIQTVTGRPFWPLDPRVEELDIRDIAHSLAMQCRFGGHCHRFYSVAEHSVWCALVSLRPADCYMFCKNQWAAVKKVKRWFGDGNPKDFIETDIQRALAALMHDAAEAYLVDLPKPVKLSLPDYRVIEGEVEKVIWRRFNLPLVPHCEIKRIDTRMLVTEIQHLMTLPPFPWMVEDDPYPLRGETLGCDPADARRSFMEMWKLLHQMLGLEPAQVAQAS